MNSEDVSVVVQGPIIAATCESQYSTAAALRSVRRFLPKAEIILSTWKGSEVAGLDYDLLIESTDPGALPNANPDWRPWNINRQIVSTQAGFQRASRPYGLKLRTDFQLENADILTWAGKFPDRHHHYRFFSERLVGCERYFCDPAKPAGVALFHPSDLVQFGRTADLLDLWSIPLAPPEIVLPPEDRPRHDGHDPMLLRCQAEQYIWLAYLAKRGHPVDLRYRWQFSTPWAYLSEVSIINNFVIAHPGQIGVKLAPRLTLGSDADVVYSHADWVKLDETYCKQGGSIIRQCRRQLQLHYAHFSRVVRHALNRCRTFLGRIKSTWKS